MNINKLNTGFHRVRHLALSSYVIMVPFTPRRELYSFLAAFLKATFHNESLGSATDPYYTQSTITKFWMHVTKFLDLRSEQNTTFLEHFLANSTCSMLKTLSLSTCVLLKALHYDSGRVCYFCMYIIITISVICPFYIAMHRLSLLDKQHLTFSPFVWFRYP